MMPLMPLNLTSRLQAYCLIIAFNQLIFFAETYLIYCIFIGNLFFWSYDMDLV